MLSKTTLSAVAAMKWKLCTVKGSDNGQATRSLFVAVALLCVLGVCRVSQAQRYATSVVGTDFDFITTTDPSAFTRLEFTNFGRAEMPDKRPGGRGLFQDAFVFLASFNDAARVEIFVDASFATEEAAEAEARRYVHPLGRLPKTLRKGVDRLVVHAGGKETTAFSDEGLIVVYADNVTQRIGTHDLEETIFHESVHAAWDQRYAKSDGWKRAQMADGAFITAYAKKKPQLEDLAESTLFAHTLLHHPERLPADDRNHLRATIPNRLMFIAELLAAE